jgi:putative MATE family efflux protein
VNLVAPVLLVLGAVTTTVGIGGASLVSRCLGAGDRPGAARAAGNAFAIFWVTAVTVTVGGLLALRPLLTVLGARGSARDMAGDYAVIILAGALVSTGFSSLVRAEGRMRFSTLLWVIPVLVQITADPLLIFGLHLGVRGAALGTVGGQSVSAAMSIWFFFVQKNRPYTITRRAIRLHGPTIRALLGVGAPSFLAGLGASLLAVLVNNIVAHGLAPAAGVAVLAAYAVCARIQTFVRMPQLGISQGLQPIVGYNAGSRQFDRVRRARTLALRATLVYGVVTATVVVLFARPLIAVFIDDRAVAATADRALRIIAIGMAVAGVAPLISAYCQALGRATPSYVISIGTLIVIKAPLVLLLGRAGPTATWAALTIGEFASALTALLILRALPPSPRPAAS